MRNVDPPTMTKSEKLEEVLSMSTVTVETLLKHGPAQPGHGEMGHGADRARQAGRHDMEELVAFYHDKCCGGLADTEKHILVSLFRKVRPPAPLVLYGAIAL